MHLREASMPFIDYSHNMHDKQMICIKFWAHVKGGQVTKPIMHGCEIL